MPEVYVEPVSTDIPPGDVPVEGLSRLEGGDEVHPPEPADPRAQTDNLSRSPLPIPEPRCVSPRSGGGPGGLTARIRRIAGDEHRVRVLVADDHPVFREGIVRALEGNPGTEVIAQVGDGRAAFETISTELPDVALLDYKLPELDGIDVARAVVREALPTRVLMLSAHDESSVVYDALQAGASGYLLKEASRDEIVEAVLAVAHGKSVLPAEIAAGLVGEIQLRSPAGTPALTKREREILRLIADGKSFSEIGAALFIGVTTVKSHAQHVYEKLGVSDRAAAVAEALRRHLIE